MGEFPQGAPVAVVAGRYRVHEQVGAGGMGTVWRASDELLGREVALKQVRLGDQPAPDIALARERTMREARIAAALHHPHIVSIFDVVLQGGDPWLVLEYLPSRSLGSVLDESGTLPPAEVAAIGAAVADALAAAHAARIVHRDVKPDNVLLSRPSAAGPVVKLTDFGIAHTAAAPAITATHVLTGTPAYFAPETARGEGTDARSDVYSLGATLYAAVEGHPPFGTDSGNVLALLTRVARGGAPRPQRAGPLTDLLSRLTADEPSQRPTAAQAHVALRAIAADVPRPVDPGRTVPTRSGPDHPDATTPTPAGRSPSGPTVLGPAPADVTRPTAAKRRRRGAGVVAAVAAALAVAAGVLVAVTVSGPDAAEGPAVAAGAPAGPTPQAGPLVGIADPATADPCSLLLTDPLDRFGSTNLDPHNVAFAGCRADVIRPEGNSVGYTVTFENEAEVARVTGGGRKKVSGFPVLSYPSGDDFCDRRILLAEGDAVLVSAVSHDETTPPKDLCAIVEAGTAAAIEQLVTSGIGTRKRLAPDSHLAGVDACTLLTTADLAALPTATPPRPRFGGWGCDWSSYTDEGEVALSYYRGYPLADADGVTADFAGHPGRVLAKPGNCWVQFVQRNYAAGGSAHIEAVWVNYFGTGTDAELCATATALATAAARKLPAPA